MIKLKHVLLMFIVLLGQFAIGQTMNINGVVTAADGVPLPGASVVVQGTSRGTQTDFDGNFSIEASPGNVLIISYIGYVSQSITVNNDQPLAIVLAEDLQALDEVVVVGYGTQSRAEVSGAISTIDSEELTAIPVANAESALQGRAAGVTVISSGSSGNGSRGSYQGSWYYEQQFSLVRNRWRNIAKWPGRLKSERY